MNLERHLILSQSDWGDLFSNRKVTGAAYICILIGYTLCLFNYGVDIANYRLTNTAVYGSIILAILTLMALGIHFRKYFAIPLSIIGLNFSHISLVLYENIILGESISEVAVYYSVMYYIINSLIFRLSVVFYLNFAVMCTVTFCAGLSAYAPDMVQNESPQPLMLNAIILSVAALLLQHLVLTVRAILIEQLGAANLHVAALQAEIEIEKAKKEAREKTIQLNRISVIEALGASIAHEIKQPITAALTYCQAARNWSAIEINDAPETMQAIHGIENNVTRASRLIDNIRLLTTNKDREYALADIRSIVRDQVTLVRAEFDRRDIRISLVMPSTRLLAEVCAPEVALATINLLRNAMEAFDEPADGAVVSVQCRQPSPDWIEILVTDNGRGLSPEGILTAFGAFQTTKETGAGIGLSICQEVAEHHSGSISLEANPAGGLTATLRLATSHSEN